MEGFLKEYEEAGFKDGVIIKAAGEEMDLTVAHIDSEYKIGYDLTRELLEETRDITAIVGLNDMIAFGILDALQEEKIRVPAEMSVMGCDNTLFARIHKVALTTIDHFVVYKLSLIKISRRCKGNLFKKRRCRNLWISRRI